MKVDLDRWTQRFENSSLAGLARRKGIDFALIPESIQRLQKT